MSVFFFEAALIVVLIGVWGLDVNSGRWMGAGGLDRSG